MDLRTYDLPELLILVMCRPFILGLILTDLESVFRKLLYVVPRTPFLVNVYTFYDRPVSILV